MAKNIIGSVIKDIRKNRKMTQKQLSELTGYSQNTISNHENGVRSLDENNIATYAKALNVTPDKFFEALSIKTSLENKIMIVDKSETYKNNLMDLINELEESRQKKVYNFAKKEYNEQKSNVVDMRKWKDVYIQSKVSAGRGIVDLDQQHKELISYDGYVPSKYDLAFQVEGNSMEPMFRDGEVIFVEHQEEVRNGQLGVVTINDEAYIKKIYLEDDCLRLVSLNKEYDDIIADSEDTIKVVGKVIL